MNTNEIYVILVEAKSTKFFRNDAQGERNAGPRFQKLLTLLGRRIIWMPVLAFIASLSINIGSATTLVNGANQTGTIFTGTTNSYTFTANTGDNVNLRVGTTNFDGWLQLFGPDGKLLATGTGAGSTDAYIDNYTATNSGTFTVLVSSWYTDQSGTYGLTANALIDDLRLCFPVISGTNLTLNGVGGTNGAGFKLYSTTNIATSWALWTPVLTHNFDQFGVLNYTNTYNPAHPQKYFRFVVP